jgi:hypothetical protein
VTMKLLYSRTGHSRIRGKVFVCKQRGCPTQEQHNTKLRVLCCVSRAVYVGLLTEVDNRLLAL